jgi:cell division protein FtsL
VGKKSFSAIRILLIALLIYMSGELIFTTYYYFNTKQQAQELSTKIADLKNQNEQIQQEIQAATTQAFIEEKAREDLMLAKSGETIIYFKWDQPQQQTTAAQNGNFIKKFFDSLLKLFQK